jgi:acyl-CoA thioesterase FadM
VESQTGRLIADGSTVQACFDPETKKTKSIPDEMREQIREFEGIAE